MSIVSLCQVPSRSEAESIIKKLAMDGKISWTKHCKDRMKERGITMPQIVNCLLKGCVTEEPFVNYSNGGGYETRIEKGTAGDGLRVVVCMKFNQTLLIITAIN